MWQSTNECVSGDMYVSVLYGCESVSVYVIMCTSECMRKGGVFVCVCTHVSTGMYVNVCIHVSTAVSVCMSVCACM